MGTWSIHGTGDFQLPTWITWLQPSLSARFLVKRACGAAASHAPPRMMRSVDPLTMWWSLAGWFQTWEKLWEKYGKSVVWVEGVAGWPFLGDLWDILDPKWMSLNKNKTEYYYRIFKMLIGDGPAPPVEECWGTEKGLPLTSFTRSTCTRCRLGDCRTFSDSVAGVEPQKNRLKWEILAFCSRIGPEYSLI